MDVFEEQNSCRESIPGLPDSERHGKKGRKKGQEKGKKTLTLQTFLQDENQDQDCPQSGVEEGGLDTQMAKLNLDQEELIVMESCHSYIHDMRRHVGPTNAMDPILQHEIQAFPPEAKRIIQKCGGYRNFILRSKDLAVVDKIVAAKSDLRTAQEMAFNEIYNNLPPPSNSYSTKNENINQESKEIWTSKSNIMRNQEEGSRMFHDQKSNSLFYQSTTNQNQDQEFSKSDTFGNSESCSAQQNLLKGLGQPAASAFSYSSGNQLEELRERVWKLQEENQELNLRLVDREQLEADLAALQSQNTALESLQNNTKNLLVMTRGELEQTRAEMTRMARGGGDGGEAGGAREIILGLQRNLESQQLRNLALTQELETKKQGVFGTERNPWSSPGLGSSLNTGDSDLLGLRSLHPGTWSGEAISAQAPAPSLLPPSSAAFQPANSRPMFGGLGASLSLPSPTHFSQALASEHSGLGIDLLGDTREEPKQTNSPPILEQRSPQSPPGFYSPALQQPRFSQEEQEEQDDQEQESSLVPPPDPAPPAPATTKLARQEMLVRKLVSMLPPGTSEETIKSCIQELRNRNGKLSGWPTSKIAQAIADLLHNGEA